MEVNEVERRLLDIQGQNDSLLRTLKSINRYLVSREPVGNDTSRLTENQTLTSSGETVEEAPLYRVHRNGCHHSPSQSPYNRYLGIRCPGWRRYSSADFEITAQYITQHLQTGDKSSPPFISVTDSAYRHAIDMACKADDTGRSRHGAGRMCVSLLQGFTMHLPQRTFGNGDIASGTWQGTRLGALSISLGIPSARTREICGNERNCVCSRKICRGNMTRINGE